MNERSLASVWPVAQQPAREQRRGRYLPESAAHPGKMLPALARHAIEAFSAPGELVLDPMCGIGTTLVEAVHLGRRAVGVELEARWAALAAQNVCLAREHGAHGRGLVIRGDARQLARGLLDELAGQVSLILTSPPYGRSTHGQVRKRAGRIEKFDERYSDNPANLAHLPQRRDSTCRPPFMQADLAVALRHTSPPARRRPRQRQTDRDRGRTHTQEPPPPCNDRRTTQLGLRLGLVLRSRTSAPRSVRARRGCAPRQRHHSPLSARTDRLAAARRHGSRLRLMPSQRFERRHVPHPRPRRRDDVELATDSSHLADLIAERLVAHSRERSRWIGADVVADHLGVDVSYVYEHAAELGARRLGTGPRARLRFRLDLVDEALRPTAGRSDNQTLSTTAPSRRRQASPSSGHVPLLPVRRSRSDA